MRKPDEFWDWMGEMTNKPLPRSQGRTTRMLDTALKLSSEGKKVYVVAANRAEVSRLTLQLQTYLNSFLPQSDIKVVTPSATFDWSTLTFTGLSAGSVVLVDHRAIEDRFKTVLKELHAYD